MNELKFVRGSKRIPVTFGCKHQINEYTNRCEICGRDILNIIQDSWMEWVDTVEINTGKIISHRRILPPKWR